MEHNFDHHGQIDLPPGFRFHPTDEELISHYLYPKVSDSNFVARAIGEVNLNIVEPWELPWRAKLGEHEWFFFCIRDRKYPTGSRTNRATSAGYWKATGKDKEIYKERSLVGMKKTLVFYKGRAPKGQKTDWVMHEYRLEGMFSENNLPKSAKGEWVISRVFHKNSAGKKIPISEISRMNHGNLPPLMDISSGDGGSRTENSHAPCFSESIEEPNANNKQEMMGIECVYPMVTNMAYHDSTWMQDPSILKVLMDANMSQNPKTEMVDDQDYGVNLGGQVDVDYMWNY